MNARDPHAIADVQNTEDRRELPIEKVGIRGIRHPITVLQRSGNPLGTVANCGLYVSLPKHLKGTHMSRFVELLNELDAPLTPAMFEPLMHGMLKQLDADSGEISMRFPFFVTKSAPVSGVQSVLDYEVDYTACIDSSGHYSFVLKVLVPVTSLCPCSRKISAYGAHNQRSHVTITATSQHDLAVEDLIDLVEQEASCELYGLLKRTDEKFVTERAYDNPKFVEDMVRDIAVRLNAEPRVLAYTLEAENFESIHNHSAYALISADKR
jgi:GTP cyclohydrolase IB